MEPVEVIKAKRGTGSADESVVARSAVVVNQAVVVSRFRGRAMVLERHPYPHYVPLRKERFEEIAYPLLGGVTRSRMSDVFSFVSNTAADLTGNDHLIAFGTAGGSKGSAVTKIWDMEKLAFREDVTVNETIWRSPYGVIEDSERVRFVMDLAKGDPGVYDDIMQSLAPLVMAKKPDGVIWWVGDGANGKSCLTSAIYHIFPGQLSSITVKRLVDGRDTPSLNGTLANVVKESSEGRIDDTEIYKSIGTHEDFKVHKFHSQDDAAIRGNLHHIFSANSIPAFNDKGFSARRRTFIVPFLNRFETDPTFEDRTFNAELFGHLIYEMCRYAEQLRVQGYRYKWSAVTLAAKAGYDVDANNAEDFTRHMIDTGVVGFDSFIPIKVEYENWCAENGHVPLGVNNLRRAITGIGFEKVSVDKEKMYCLTGINKKDLIGVGPSRPGVYTIYGSDAPTSPHAADPEPEEPQEDLLSKLGDKWSWEN